MKNPFAKYVIQKVFWYLLAFFVAISLNFLLPRLIPGNPVAVIVNQMASGGAPSEVLEKLYKTFMNEFGLDKPIYIQYLSYIKKTLSFDLGTSFMLYPSKIRDLLGKALPWTIGLQIPAILTGWIVGNILGAVCAYKDGKFDSVAFTLALVFSNIPYYCLAIIFLYFFAIIIGIFPVAGGYTYGMIPNLSWHFIKDLLHHYFLPYLSMVLVAIGGQAIGMREMSIYELTSDYVSYARNLGVRDRRIIKYVFRNAMLPQITGLAIAFGTMMGGALVTETVFSYPGVGTLLFSAIRQSDYPLIQGCTLLITIAVLTANFLVEIAYGIIDPRIRAVQVGER
ncbi:MAG: ABC transporter permease [Dictyoglomaceae bacterium]|nr:ABC transporter permease [Dictyoglomaceae bacterium]